MKLMIHIKNLPKGTRLFTFDQLGNVAKVVAREEIKNDFWKAHRRGVNAYKILVCINIHRRINDRRKFRAISHSGFHCRLLDRDQSKLDSTILSNLCHFTNDGVYIRYLSPKS